MLSYSKAQDRGGTKRYVEGSCLSTDTKPTTDISNGSMLLEMDTGKIFVFDEENSEWKEF